MKRIIKLTESDLTRIVKRVINESTQFVEETLLNRDTGYVRVYAQTNFLDGEQLRGANVDWYTSERDIKTMGGPGIKITLPNGEMESYESIKVYVISRATNKNIATFTLDADEIKTNNAKGKVFKTQKANVQGKKVNCMFKWNPNGITVKGTFMDNLYQAGKRVAKEKGGGGSKTAARATSVGSALRNTASSVINAMKQ